jgi:endoglucanase
MKKLLTILILSFHAVSLLFSQSIIKVNQLGYLTGYPKCAWVNDVPVKEFRWTVRNSVNRAIVFSALATASDQTDPATGEKVTLLDFSSLKTPGSYYIEIDDIGISFEFPVSDKAYNVVWRAGVKSYYFQRSGMDLTPEYAGIWARKAAHSNDALMYKGYSNGKIIEGESRNYKGGWYDAGDFGKKIVPACMAFYPFLKLAEMYPEKIHYAGIDIPNPWPGLPDMLAEVKWELDWFFTMQEADGAVHHLIVSPDFYMGPPQEDHLPRYVLPVSSTATADFAAGMAMASKVYLPYLPSFADSCLVAAEKAWEYLIGHPGVFPAGGYTDPEGIHNTGAYGDPFDSDERIWAAAELFNTTGKKEYGHYVESRQEDFKVTSFSWWFDPHNYAIYSWLLAPHPGKDPCLVSKLKDNIRHFADSVSRVSLTHGYGVILAPDEYFWGSNSYVLNYGMELLIINRILDTQVYTATALHQLNYILGCNSLNLSFVSGYGTNAVKDPHQSINSYDTLNLAPPGFIPGGPNQNKEDPFLTRLIQTKNPPPAKCYVDFHWAYACNEVCLPYNSGLIFLAGYFLK